ncbi:MAG: DUF3267 domain-containing protein [Anaerolineales bacterium]|nr:DUF3267 domain-containing protein [Anaerolineales bacterium]
MIDSQDAPAQLPGYREAYRWDMRVHRRTLIRVSLLGLLVVPLVYIGFARLAVWISPQVRLSYGFEGRQIFWTLLAIALGMVLMVVLHEGTHGVFMILFRAKPQYGVDWEHGVVYATSHGHAFTRNQFIVVALAPVLVVSGLGLLPFIWPLPGPLVTGLLTMLAFNFVGAVGDAWMTGMCLRYPASARVVDERYGIKVFMQEKE